MFDTNLTNISSKMMLSFQLRLTLYSCLLGTVVMTRACDIARPCEQGDHSRSLKDQVKNFYCVVESNHFLKKFMKKSGIDVLPGSQQRCPLPLLPTDLRRKPRFKATLKNFYQDFATYFVLVDKITEMHTDLSSEFSQKITMPMCDILCLGYTKLKSRKKTQNIARKLRKKYKKFTMSNSNTCQIYQPVTMLESLKSYLQNALPKLVEKKNRRTRRRTKRRKNKGKKRVSGRKNKKRKTKKNRTLSSSS